ncbi:MAG: hypothetical protein WD078_06410 [Woeseia sp.]
MNKRIWMVVMLAMALGACSVERYLAAPERCQAGRTITINHGPPGIIVAPPDLCVNPGDTITVNISPPAKVNTVSTTAKSGKVADNWMNRSNDQPESFELKVPEDATACSEDRINDTCKFGYTIEITDFIIFDPMITIRQ